MEVFKYNCDKKNTLKVVQIYPSSPNRQYSEYSFDSVNLSFGTQRASFTPLRSQTKESWALRQVNQNIILQTVFYLCWLSTSTQFKRNQIFLVYWCIFTTVFGIVIFPRLFNAYGNKVNLYITSICLYSVTVQ